MLYQLGDIRVVQKVLSFIQELKEQESFSEFFYVVPLDINALCPMMLKHCNSITEEDGVLGHQKHVQNTYDLIIVFKMTTL